MALHAGWLGTNFKYLALNQTVKERTRVKFYNSISEVNAAYSPHDNIISEFSPPYLLTIFFFFFYSESEIYHYIITYKTFA